MSIDEPGPRGPSVMVLLTEMRGDLKLVLQQMADLIPRVAEHDKAIVQLLLDTQRLTIEADAREKAAAKIQSAVAAQKTAEHEDALAESAKETAQADRTWSPVSKITTVMGCLAVTWALLDALLPK